MPTASTTYFNRNDALVDLTSGQGRETFLRFLETLAGLSIIVNGIPGVNRWALAGQPSLGPADEGYIAYVTDYGHVVRFTGTIWEFAAGDPGNGFFSARAVAPQEPGWQLCDGTVTSYLTVGGATLTATAFTTPTVPAGTFLKTLAAYTGAIDAAIGAGLSGAPAAATATISGDTADEAAHTHTFSGQTEIDNSDSGTPFGADQFNGTDTATHPFSGTTDAGSPHKHGKGTLSVDSHAHGIGTLAVDSAARPPSLGTLLYFRK